MGRIQATAAVLLVALSWACAGRKSAAGFHLPDGDPEHGQRVFVDMRCHACHRVDGMPELSAPVADPPVAVVIGGDWPTVRTDGELVTAIIDPSHRMAPRYQLASMRTGQLSPMGNFSDAMTVREMIDLVAFIQSRYRVVQPVPAVR